MYLPSFYADFEHEDGRFCAADVAKEIEKLKAAKVDGIIMDIRNNGGGSLEEVVKMSGLFIERGPIVQVKSKGKNPLVKQDFNPSVSYDGPLSSWSIREVLRLRKSSPPRCRITTVPSLWAANPPWQRHRSDICEPG